VEENLKDEIIELYETLADNGVTFYYGSESIATGEVTKFNILNEEIIEIELDGFETYEINIDDFIEQHSKEGANYHTWPDIRKFDKKLIEMKNGE
jgi:hypothetical protein